MGVDISGPSYIYGYNMSVIYNTQCKESQLKNKINSICYHAVRESFDMSESLTGNIGTSDNVADLDTNVLYGGKRKFIARKLMYDIYDNP